MAFDPALFILLGCGVNGAIASGDFTIIGEMDAVQGVYALNGAPCTLADLFDEASSKYLFDPVRDMDAGGVKIWVEDTGGGNFVYHGRALPLANPLLASMLADGFTIVMEGFWGTEESDNDALFVEAMNVDESFYADVFIGDGSGSMTSFDGNSPDPGPPGAGNDIIKKVAATMTDERSAVSVGGGAVTAFEEPALDPTTTLVFFGLSGRAQARLRSFAIYAPVDDADLPALSAP